jgi:hypothetical protein
MLLICPSTGPKSLSLQQLRMFAIVGGNGMERSGCGPAGQLVKSRFMDPGMGRDGMSRVCLIWAGIGNIKLRDLCNFKVTLHLPRNWLRS